MTVFKGGRRSKAGQRTGLGASFTGLAAYLERGPRSAPDLDRVEWTASRNLDGLDDPRDAALVMRAHADELSARVELPVYHCGLSLPQGERLTPEQWGEAIGRVLDSMGLGDHQALLIAHRDTPHPHVHVMVNRVGDDGKVWKPFRDMVKARQPIPGIERDFGLRRTGSREAARELDPPAPSSGAYAEARRTGQQPLADRVREQAGEAFARATGWRDLELRLAELGYRLERAARGSGVVVTDGRRRASLSRVDRTLSGPKLAQRFGETFKDYRAHTPEPPRVTPPPGQEIEPLAGATLGERAGALVDRVSATRASFTAADLERAAFYHADSVALVREALQSPHVLELGKHAHGPVRYASREYVEIEARMFAAAGQLAARADLRLDAAGVAQTVESRVIPRPSFRSFPWRQKAEGAAVPDSTGGG